MKRILTVDDSKTIRRIVKSLFEGYDCEIIEATNGVDGLKKAEEYQPDIILLDVSMPRMNGKDMLKKLQEHPQLFIIPVVMLTAEGGKKAVSGYLQQGACGFVVKPFHKEYLLDKVIQIIKLTKADPKG